jgi:hypothetical protein
MAWKTRDVDESYSESKWIFALILVHFQVLLVAMPLIVILEDSSGDGRYIGWALILWTIPMSTMVSMVILSSLQPVRLPL